jgi:hypothetical protein
MDRGDGTDDVRPAFVYPRKPVPGSRVAVVSPSAGLPAVFPAPFELGLRRLRDEFELEPVEYPTTRTTDASLTARADDLHAAFADPDIAAIITSIGGDDQLKLLAHLDPSCCVRTQNHSSGTATTRTCCTCCGASGSWATTGVPSWSNWAGREPCIR